MNEILTSQAFELMLSFLFYVFGYHLYKKTKMPLFNPLLISTLLLMGYIWLMGIEVQKFLTDLNGLNAFLGLVIVALAVPIFKQIGLIKKNLLPILIGSLVGTVVSITSVILLGRLMGLDSVIINSVIPKSSTTPIAIEVSAKLGGIKGITVAAVLITAVAGPLIIPIIVKIFRIKDPKIIGLGLGSISHVVGTAKAMEIDQTAGAISGISLVVSGIATVIIALFL
jgi:putative effector of murein hydrolase